MTAGMRFWTGCARACRLGEQWYACGSLPPLACRQPAVASGCRDAGSEPGGQQEDDAALLERALSEYAASTSCSWPGATTVLCAI